MAAYGSDGEAEHGNKRKRDQRGEPAPRRIVTTRVEQPASHDTKRHKAEPSVPGNSSTSRGKGGNAQPTHRDRPTQQEVTQALPKEEEDYMSRTQILDISKIKASERKVVVATPIVMASSANVALATSVEVKKAPARR